MLKLVLRARVAQRQRNRFVIGRLAVRIRSRAPLVIANFY